MTNGEDRFEARSASAERRQTELLELVRREGRLDVAPTAARIGVTQETLRRDLRVMERAGLIRRGYGAAFPVESGRFESSFDAAAASRTEEKARIAAAAAAQLGTARTVYLDEGYLPLLIGKELRDVPVTIVTSSLPTAMELAPETGSEVILVGGRVRGVTLATVDQGHDSLLTKLSIDLAYISANGISEGGGLTTADPAVAAVKSAAMTAATRRIAVGTHTTFGVTGFIRFATVGEFEAIVTDDRFPAQRVPRYTRLGPRFLRV